MNEEIKEILNGLNVVIKHDGSVEINSKECEKIIDCITNLQEENEKVHKDFTELSERYFFTKSRCEKAIEYIEVNTYKSYETDYMDLTGIKELLNILNGGNEE